MTPGEIRALAIDRLARVQFELDNPGVGEEYEDWASVYRREVTKFVDALGDLLPTHEKIRANLDRCYATDWRKTPDSGAA